jgi:hypothetical protein
MDSTRIVGFDIPLEIGKEYTKRLTSHILPVRSIGRVRFKVLRIATRAEWEAQGLSAKNNERVARGHFYEIQALD